MGDRIRLQQILLNVAGNAVKFTEQGGVEVRLGASARGGGICLEFAVQDTGIGIPKSVREHLFEPFTQADASIARRFGGTGLGLSIAKSFVEMMGGHIRVESQPGKGSTFSFTVLLPLAGELPAGFGATVSVPAAACTRLRVLLVEDNPANQKVAAFVLQDRGHAVEMAGTGQQAIEMTERNRYDVVLMDVEMPGINGLDAAAAIRKREQGGSRLPIIAMTAHALEGDRERCLAAGMDGYLSKPINTQEMIALVETRARDARGTDADRTTPGAAAAVPRRAAVVFNAEDALKRCFNQRQMLRQMIQCFFDDLDLLFPQIRAALDKGDLKEVGQLAHRMRGTLFYLGAQAAGEAALGVERLCKSSDATSSATRTEVGAFEQECLRLRIDLAAHRA